MSNSNPAHQILTEDQITVYDYGRTGSTFPRPLSQYLSRDISSLLVNARLPRTSAVLDAELASVDAIIASLQALKGFKRRLRNCYIPIAGLPAEILSEIFIACLNEYRDTNFDEPLSTTVPLVLSQVCSTWRQVARQVPQLWSVVHCHILSPQSSPSQAAMLSQWLSRSGALPLKIKISFRNERDWAHSRNACPLHVLDVIIHYSNRWQDADLTLPIFWYGSLRLAQYPLLENLLLRPPGSLKYSGRTLKGFENAPRLTSVHFNLYLLRFLDLPWANLTIATIGTPSLDDTLEFVARCQHLTSLHVIDATVDQNSFTVGPKTHLLLQNLSFTVKTATFDDLISPTLIIDRLQVPSLRSISVRLLPMDDTNPLSNIARLIRRSNCPLAHVAVHGPHLTEREIVSFLRENEPVLRLVN